MIDISFFILSFFAEKAAIFWQFCSTITYEKCKKAIFATF